VAAVPAGLREAIAALVAQMRDDAGERERRWGRGFPVVVEAARRGRLHLPCGSWFHGLELDADGVVHVLTGDPPGDSPGERPLANALEANFAWYGALERYPELRAFAPVRPEDATTCPECAGTGRPSWHAMHPHVVCRCGRAGWLPAGVDEMAAYADGMEWTDSPAPAPRQSILGDWWRRVRGSG
jgi:hypothetical protein